MSRSIPALVVLVLLACAAGIAIASARDSSLVRTPAPGGVSAAPPSLDAGPTLDPARVLRGEQIYREGRLSTGGRMEASIRGEPVDGTLFACIRCHQRSGLGTVEGRIATPAVTGAALFRPLWPVYHDVLVTSGDPKRPAYTPETLARALRRGLDPTGHPLDPAMPRFELPDSAVSDLISYLTSLSIAASPGVSSDEIRIATIVADGVDDGDRDAMLYVLRKYVALKNGQTDRLNEGGDARSALMRARMTSSEDLGGKRLNLAIWALSGMPETWRAQLDAYQDAQPVFAILGGISPGAWGPIRDFAESRHVPVLFPVTPPTGDARGWYTLYPSNPYAQEGAGAARYLASLPLPERPTRITQIVRATPAGETLRHAFEDAWREHDPRAAVSTVFVDEGESAVEAARGAASTDPGGVFAVWDGPGAFEIVDALGRGGARRARVVLSSTYVGDALWGLAERAGLAEPLRARTYIAYPHRMPDDEKRFDVVVRPWVAGALPSVLARRYRVISAAIAATEVFTGALAEARGRYSPDFLLETIDGMRDLGLPSFEHASFGPGQRFASKGCYVVKVSAGTAFQEVTKVMTDVKRVSSWLTF